MRRGKGLKLFSLILPILLLALASNAKEVVTQLISGIDKAAVEAGLSPAATPVPTPSPTPDETPAPSAAAKTGKLVALTFDDGPDNKFTPAVMDVLKEKGVKATFFVVGIQVVQYPETMKRIVDEGHIIGNHSWDHKQLTKLSKDAVEQEIDKTNQAIHDAVDETTTWFRAPYGALDSQTRDVIAKAGDTHVGWTVDTRDWAGTSPEEMMATTKRQLKPGGIVLMHSFGGKGGKLNNTLEFLPELIDFLNNEGYSIVTIPELFEARKK